MNGALKPRYTNLKYVKERRIPAYLVAYWLVSDAQCRRAKVRRLVRWCLEEVVVLPFVAVAVVVIIIIISYKKRYSKIPFFFKIYFGVKYMVAEIWVWFGMGPA